MATPSKIPFLSASSKAAHEFTRGELKLLFRNPAMWPGKERLAHQLSALYGAGFMRELFDEINADAAGLSLAEYRGRVAARIAEIRAGEAAATASRIARQQAQVHALPIRNLTTRFALAIANLI